MGHGQDGPSLRSQSRGKNESPMTGVPSPHRNLLAPFSGSRCPREKVQIPHWLQRPCGSWLTFFNLTYYPQLTHLTPHTFLQLCPHSMPPGLCIYGALCLGVTHTHSQLQG